MQPIPRHWATAREVRTTSEGREFDLTIHGSSDVSPEDARRDAQERLERLIASGGPGAAVGSDIEYYPARRLPEELLEEIHAPNGALIAAITRNRYGAAVLNTDAVLISDIDLPASSRPPARGKRGLLSRLFGGGGADAAAEPDPDALGLPGPGERGDAHARIVQRIEGFAQAHPELGMRSYRTRNGFRVLLTGAGAEPTGDRAQELMAELHSDRLYMLLSRVHDSYRARLTPKPWRIEVDRFEQLGSRTAQDSVHTDWVERYRAASREVAVCRLLTATGPAPTEVEQQIIDLHDRATRHDSGLALA